MEEGCSMKGFLELLTLALISKKNVSGHDVRKELGKRRGCIPSPGTIYPVLKGLQRKGLIEEAESVGKEKKYRVTAKGRRELEKNKKIFSCLFQELY